MSSFTRYVAGRNATVNMPITSRQIHGATRNVTSDSLFDCCNMLHTSCATTVPTPMEHPYNVGGDDSEVCDPMACEMQHGHIEQSVFVQRKPVNAFRSIRRMHRTRKVTEVKGGSC